MKRTIALAAALAGAIALTVSSSAYAQNSRGKTNFGPHNFSFSFGMHQGRLGAQVTSMSPDLRRHFGAPAQWGLLVNKVMPNTPAASAGIQTGDIITKVDGKSVAQPWDVMKALANKKKGDKVAIEIVRNRKLMTKVATLKDNGFGLPNMPNMAGFSKAFGNFSKHFNQAWGNGQWKQFLGKDFDVIIKGLNNGHIDLNKLRNLGQNLGKPNSALQKKLKETMKRVLELEKAMKSMQGKKTK